MRDYSDRLHAAIPGGAHTYSRGDDQYPSNAPKILERGKGAYVWDPDGKRFLDYGMGLRTVTVGYADDRVNAAAAGELAKGVNLTRASLTELQAAETLIDLIPSADMVKFAKHGSSVTTAAAKIARAFTGRRFICVPRQHPFFSFDDWFIGTTALKRGIPEEHYSATLQFDYGDIESLERLFAAHPKQIAGVMLEPATTLLPCARGCTTQLTVDEPCAACAQSGGNFLLKVQSLCRAQGALFILDEMITGFRWHLQGAQTYFGVDPDLTTFGKAMANGFAMAAVCGRRDIMEVGSIRNAGAERTFLVSTTHGAEMSALGAFLETVRIYKDEDVVRHLWTYGESLRKGFEELISSHGLRNHVHIEGASVLMNWLMRDRDMQLSPAMRTLFLQEMIKGGVLMPCISVSQAHGSTELDLTLNAMNNALKVCAGALESGVDRFLEGPAVKPVFRKYN